MKLQTTPQFAELQVRKPMDIDTFHQQIAFGSEHDRSLAALRALTHCPLAGADADDGSASRSWPDGWVSWL
ncbi:MAG: hypothetical protein AAGC60_05685 [Acidobacteriota bacterium]